MKSLIIHLVVGGILVFIGWLLWFLVRRWNRSKAILKSATPLAIPAVNVWDTVWIRGHAQCMEACLAPYFGYNCLHYNYKLEELIEKITTTTNAQGEEKTERRTEWVTRQTESDSSPFAIAQGEHSLSVDNQRAEWHYEQTQTETLGKWRYSLTYTPYPCELSVVGVVGESKKTLEPLMHVPLVVTPLERTAYFVKADSGERWAARFGLLFLFLGFFAVTYGALRHMQGANEDAWWDSGRATAAGLAALGVTLFLAVFRVFNSLTTFKNRVEQSWSGIDILLKQRYDLIPNLVQIVKGYMAHEKGLLENLTALRSSVQGGSRDVVVNAELAALQCLTQVFGRVEAYPNLKADAQFRNLAKQITTLEDKIAHARGFYNDSVKEYNTQATVFPANLVAGALGFKPSTMFAAEAAEKPVPQLNL